MSIRVKSLKIFKIVKKVNRKNILKQKVKYCQIPCQVLAFVRETIIFFRKSTMASYHYGENSDILSNY